MLGFMSMPSLSLLREIASKVELPLQNKEQPSKESCSLFGCWVFTYGEDSCGAKLTSKLDASAPRM